MDLWAYKVSLKQAFDRFIDIHAAQTPLCRLVHKHWDCIPVSVVSTDIFVELQLVPAEHWSWTNWSSIQTDVSEISLDMLCNSVSRMFTVGTKMLTLDKHFLPTYIRSDTDILCCQLSRDLWHLETALSAESSTSTWLSRCHSQNTLWQLLRNLTWNSSSASQAWVLSETAKSAVL